MSTSNQAANGKHTTAGVPHGYTSLTPFIAVADPDGALHFYETVFGATIRQQTSMEVEGKRLVVHAEVDFGNGYLQVGAANPAYKLVMPPGEDQACYSLGLYVSNVDEVVQRAVAQGARIREPLANFVSGDRYASLLDPFGVRWSVMTRVEDLSPEESDRRVEAWSRAMMEQQ